MKVLSAAAILATAAAAAAPKISLSLDTATFYNHNGIATASATSTWPQIGSTGEEHQKDFSMKCAAGPNANATTCPPPTVTAMSHDGQSIAPVRKIYLVDTDGDTVGNTHPAGYSANTGPWTEMSEISYEKRATYVIKYDADDEAGNAAEQITFVLVLDDTTPPRIEPDICTPPNHVVQAGAPVGWTAIDGETTGWTMCDSTHAVDNLVTLNSAGVTDAMANLRYTITHMTSQNGGVTTPDVLITKGTYADAQNVLTPDHAISPMNTGTYHVDITTHDFAHTYGHSGHDNEATVQVELQVMDTDPPVIVVDGPVTIPTHECGVAYTDQGATASDMHDNQIPQIPQVTTEMSTFDHETVGQYTITYNAADLHANSASAVARIVTVVDTTDPTVHVIDGCQTQHPANTTFIEPSQVLSNVKFIGAYCTDTCNNEHQAGNLTHHHSPGNAFDASLTWVDGTLASDGTRDDTPRALDPMVPDSYWIKYECCDEEENCDHSYREIEVVDDEIPWMVTNGSQIGIADPLIYEANRDDTYMDVMPICKDIIDDHNNDSPATTVGPCDPVNNVQLPQAVDMTVPDTYCLKYSCKDKVDNAAVPLSRYVIVQDTLCPTITMQGNQLEFVEAGFPYEDAGATCTDDLDGNITVTVTGDNSVTTGDAWHAARNCAEIKTLGNLGNDKSGNFYITRVPSDDKYISPESYMRVEVWCDFRAGATGGYKSIADTADVDTSSSQGECNNYGMEMYAGVQSALPSDMQGIFTTGETTSTYVCQVPSAADKLLTSAEQQIFDQHSHKYATGESASNERSAQFTSAGTGETGVWKIEYSASDVAGNPECTTLRRTVVVKDTLPPVIVLKLKRSWTNGAATEDKIIHVSAGGISHEDSRDFSVGGTNPDKTHSNPAADSTVNPNLPTDTDKYALGVPTSLMAEEATTSTSGWIIGAAASAVTGLALLGYSAKKTTVTHVPV